MKKLLVVLGLLLVLGAAVILYAVRTYNRLVDQQQAVDGQWGQVQNVYQRRADLVPNLVSTVSGAANFERSTLTAVTEARASVGRAEINPGQAPATPEQLAQFERAQGQLSSALSRLLVVVERYPELRATSNFQTLQAQLEGAENRIAVERARFNEVAIAYNSAIKRIPAVFFAAAMGFRERPYFDATAEAQTAPRVNFDPVAQPRSPASLPGP